MSNNLSQEQPKDPKDSQSGQPKFAKVVSGANDLSVGISIVIAVLLGIGIGIGLQKLTGIRWLFWLGVAWGIAAAILNLYKAYKRMQREAQEIAQNPRYTYKPNADEEDEDSPNGKYY